ncbi:MAG: peptidoglycan DD-metalloendopeptidase family protein [Clostridia bacterium]
MKHTKNIAKDIFKVIKNTDTKVVSVVVALAILLSSAGIVTNYYTVGYNVYYGETNVGTILSKDDALKVYDEVNSDIEHRKGRGLSDELSFVLTIAPASDVTGTDIYRNIVIAEDGENKCYSLSAGSVTIAKLKTREEAQEAIAQYVDSFEREDAEIYSEYTISPDVDIVTALSSVEETVDALKECGLVKVSYSDVFEEEISVEFEEIIEETDTLPKGLEYCKQEGIEGVAVKRYITFYENGKQKHDIAPVIEIIEEPVDCIVYVGTGEGGIKKNSIPWPCEGTFTSKFGKRWGRNHNGIDIAASIGTAVYAPAAGVVTFSSTKNGYGNYIIIDHGNGFETTYAHLDSRGVEEGDIVTSGDYIGAVGVTGNVTGSHLHFEVLYNGNFVDPMNYIAG